MIFRPSSKVRIASKITPLCTVYTSDESTAEIGESGVEMAAHQRLALYRTKTVETTCKSQRGDSVDRGQKVSREHLGIFGVLILIGRASRLDEVFHEFEGSLLLLPSNVPGLDQGLAF